MFSMKRVAIILLLVCAMISTLMPVRLKAAERSINNYLLSRFNGRAVAGSIGTIEAFGNVSVNGDATQRSISSGDFLQTRDSASAKLIIDNIGEIALGQNADFRVLLAKVSTIDGTERSVLVTSLSKGMMSVKLNKDSAIYVESNGMVFTAKDAAQFRAYANDGHLEVIGNVEFQDSAKYIVRPVELGATLSVRARTTRQIQIQVTDEKDRPVPDIPIIFTLGSALGKFGNAATATATTNSQGIASVSFSAGETPGTSTITATVEGTKYSWSGEITILKQVGFWSMRNKILVSAAAAAAGVATGVVISNRGDKSPISAQPPIIKPNGRTGK